MSLTITSPFMTWVDLVVDPVSETGNSQGTKVSGDGKKLFETQTHPIRRMFFQQNSICSLHFVYPWEIFKNPMPNKLIDLGEKKSKQSLNMS